MPVHGAEQLAIGARALKRRRHTPAADGSEASLAAGAQPQTVAGQAAALALEDARDGNQCVETFLHFGREPGSRAGRKTRDNSGAVGVANFRIVYLTHNFSDQDKIQVDLAGVRAAIAAWELREDKALAGDGVSGVGEHRGYAAGGRAKMHDVTIDQLAHSLQQSTLTSPQQSIVMQCWKAKTLDQRATSLKLMVDNAQAILTMNGHATCLFGAHILVLRATSRRMCPDPRLHTLGWLHEAEYRLLLQGLNKRATIQCLSQVKQDYEDQLRMRLDAVHALDYGSTVNFVLQGGSYGTRTKRLGWSDPVKIEIQIPEKDSYHFVNGKIVYEPDPSTRPSVFTCPCFSNPGDCQHSTGRNLLRSMYTTKRFSNMRRHLVTVHGYTDAMIDTYRSNNNVREGSCRAPGKSGQKSDHPIIKLLVGTTTDNRDKSGTRYTSHPLSDGYYQDGLLTSHFVKLAGRMHHKDHYNIKTAEGRKNRLGLNNCLLKAFSPNAFTGHACVHSVDFDVQCQSGEFVGSVKQ